MKKSALLFVMAIILVLSVNAFAQEDEDEGKWRNFEVTLNGGLGMPMSDLKDWNDSLGAKTGFNLGGYGGYYFTDNICFGVYFNYSQHDFEEPPSLDLKDMHYKMYNAGIYGKYALSGESNFEPFVRLSAGANFAKFATWVGSERTRMRELSYDPGLSVAGYLGAMYYTSDYGGVFFEAGYHLDFLQYDECEYSGATYLFPKDISYVHVNAGVIVFFGPE